MAIKNNAEKKAAAEKTKLENEFSFEVINGDDEKVPPQKILENLIITVNTPSFFTPSKTVWLKHFMSFKQLTGQSGTNKEFQDYFKSIMSSLDETAGDDSLTLIIDGPNLDKRTAFYKFCKKNGTVYEYNKLKTTDKTYQADLRNRIRDLCSKENVKITHDALEFLSEAVGSDTGRLSSEISKLSSYIYDKADTINIEHCHEICTKTIEMARWIFADSLAEKNIRKSFFSLKILIDILISEKTSYNPELTMFNSAVKKFQEILKTKKAAAELGFETKNYQYYSFKNKLENFSEKFPDNMLLKMHPFRAYMLHKQSTNFSNRELQLIFSTFINANKEFVSGNTNPRILLENLIFSVCTQKRK
ncbi:MAG: hypothetical protein K9M56_01855 [Victivallales bacterium]|nr:hypothetical protein [Victivallales bacterium]